MVDEPTKPKVSSRTLDIALYLLAILPAIPAPIRTLTLETPIGWWLYVLGLAAILVAAIHCRKLEDHFREWELNQRDSAIDVAADGRLTIIMARLDQMEQAGWTRETIAATGPTGLPLLGVIDDLARQQLVAARMAMQGYVGATGVSGVPSVPVVGVQGAAGSGKSVTAKGGSTLPPISVSGELSIDRTTKYLKDISENPPRTSEAVEAAVATLKGYIRAGTPRLLAAKLTLKDNDGNIIEQQ